MRVDFSTNVVTLDGTTPVCSIRLNRPEVHNAIDESVIQALEVILDKVERDTEVRALIITGTGAKTFCAGGDLQYFATLDTRKKGLEMSTRVQALLNRLSSGAKPVIAAINGDALGGGCELLTACHFRIAASTASFVYRQAANGLITGWGGGERLFHQVGRAHALKLLLSGEPIDANEALRVGLIDAVTAPDEVHSSSMAFAERITAHSPGVVAAVLELARIHYKCATDLAIKRETELFADRWMSEEFRKTIEDFQKSRRARRSRKGD